MATTLTYGRAGVCLLDSIEAISVGPKSADPIEPTELARQVRNLLGEPLDYPPLAQATIPGDRVCIGVAAGVPQVEEILVGALKAFGDAGVEEEHITILLEATSEVKEAVEEQLRAAGFADCVVQFHDPENVEELALLGVSDTGGALRLNRALCDADFVLPIGVTRGTTRKRQPSVEGIYPTFSDREAIAQYSLAMAASYPNHCSESIGEVDQCVRQLGVGIALQIIPAYRQGVASLIAAAPPSLAQAARRSYRNTWSCEVLLRGNLVIASINGGSGNQTWDNFGRALAAASSIVEPGGAIVVCSELAQLPGRALGRLAEESDMAVVEREILRTRSADCGPAIQLCRALQAGTVYLLSDLPRGIVENLGMTPIESEDELEKLAQSLRPCLVLEDAHLALPQLQLVEE